MTWDSDEFTDLFDNAPIGIHWVGPDGIILHVNGAELELMGYTRAEYVGRHIAEFHVDRLLIDDLLRRLSRGEDVHGCEARLRTKDGSVRHVIIDSNVRWDGDRFVHTRCFTRDVTERSRVRSEATRRRREAEVLADLARSINASLDLDAILQTVAESARELCDSDLSAIALRDQAGVMTFRHRSGDRLGTARDRLTVVPGHGAGGLALTSGQPVRSDNLAEDPRFTHDTIYLAAAAEEGIAAVMAVPIRIAERIEGLLWVDNRAPRPFTDGDEDVLRELAEHAAIAIGNVHLLRREQRARAEAEAANRMKDEFLATLSHELRTPLNAVLGWTVMLRAGSLDAAATTRALGVIERNTRAQAQLIEDLLDVSRIVTGKVRLDVRVLDPITVIEPALDSVRPAAEAKGLRLQSILDPRAGPISGDPDRLQQVVWNLLSNAIKFTPQGGRVHVRLQRVNAHVEVVVSDSGQGIEPELLPYVFDRFRQADSTTTRAKGGLGIGLAIVKQLVELHGGSVRVESAGGGQGATFVVSLPLRVHAGTAADRVLPPVRLGATTATASLAGVRVLVVDDQRDALDLLERLLARGEASVRRAQTVSEALDALATWRPDVVVSDIDMPGEDGYRQIHVAKPVEPAELIAIIAGLTGRLVFTSSDPHAKGRA